MDQTKIMLPSFTKMSQTGSEVLILKSLGDCSCHEPGSLINSEPDPHCKKCLGTGKERLRILSEKIRYEVFSDRPADALEIIDHVKVVDDKKVFYFYERYSFINNEDLLCTFSDGVIDRVYEVKNKEEYKCSDFSFYEVYGRKINHFINTGDIYE